MRLINDDQIEVAGAECALIAFAQVRTPYRKVEADGILPFARPKMIEARV